MSNQLAPDRQRVRWVAVTDPGSRARFARRSYLRIATVLAGMLVWITLALSDYRLAHPWAEPLGWVGWLVMMAALIWQVVANARRRREPTEDRSL